MLRYSKGIINVILLGWVCFLGKTIVADEAYAISNIGEDINRPSTELGDADWGKDDGKWTVGTGIGTGSTGGDFERVVDVDLELGNFNGQTSTQVTGTNTEIADISCSDLGYNMTKENSWKCYDMYFTCPFDANYIKCDRVARAGDIKYSTSGSAEKGWLLCDGSIFDHEKYPELKEASLATCYRGRNTGDECHVPNLIGVFLRGFGEQKIGSVTYRSAALTNIQEQAIPAHTHKVGLKTYKCSTFSYTPGGGSWYTSGVKSTTARTTYKVGAVDGSASDYCPYRIGLYPYIYAGTPAKK